MVRDPPLDGVSSADNADPKDGADTVSDEELLSVACSNPDRIPDLLSGRGNPAARDLETGRTLLQLLVLAKANKDVLEAVLKRLNEEQINALDRSDDTALSLAVDIGNTETARLLLDCGALLNLRGQNRPLLHSACASGNEKMARLLIQHGADTTALVDEKTPIAAAIRGNSVPVISLLIENGVDVDAPADSDGYTPLMLACYWEYEDIVEYLVSEKGAQVNKAQQSTTKHDETELDAVTPLHLACQWNLLKSVKFLISKDADVRAVDSKSRTVLQRAAGYASAELVEYLVSLEQIVDLIDEENHKGRTPLLKAVRRNNFPAVEVLIKNGANVNIADKEGLTPLIVALRKDRSECLQMLLARKGINVNRQGKNDLAPLMIASTVSTNPATVKRMLELEASVDDVDSAGRTALHKASYLGHGDTVRILIEEGAADPQKKDHNDQNALHKAARRGYADIVQVILNSKADVGAVDNTGWTALHYASFCQFNWSDQKKVKEELGDHYCAEYNVNERGAGCYETTMKVLLAGGAKVHVRNNDSETALHLAARPGTFNEERVELLLYLMESYDTDSLRQIFAPQEIPVDGKNASKPPANQEDLQDRLFVWASKREARRFVLLLVRISKRLYYAEKFREVFSRKETQAWDTLHWAAYMGSGLLVWQLLHTMEQTVENDDGRKSALKVAQRMKQRLEEPAGKSQGRTPAEKMASPPSRKRKDDATADNSNAPNDVVEGYQNTIDVLSDPPFVPISKTTGDPCEKPQSNNTMSLFEVTISDFYVKDSQTGFLRRNRTVKDVICDKDPGTIMRYAKKWIEDMNVRLNKQVEVDDKVSDDKEFKFRWIHLPANNVSGRQNPHDVIPDLILT